MADQGGGNNNNAPRGTGPTFRIPYAWDKNKPTFDTEDADDLIAFVDQVKQILDLANVTSDAERKKRLTEYLPRKKQDVWRELDTYTNGTFDDFLEDVYKIYPEVSSTKIGSMDALVKLCKSSRGISITEEGLLKRFGAEFHSLVKKLMKGKAITTNSEACRRYLDTLEPSFASALRMMVSSQNILKKQMRGVAPAAGNAATEERRKEDPIEISDLIKLANQMAEGQQEGAASSIGGDSVPRGRDLNSVKLERTEEKVEELAGDIAELKDAFNVVRSETKAAQTDIMKALQQVLKGPPPHMILTRPNSESNGQDRVNNSGNRGDQNCYYCGGNDHYSRDCGTKQEHIGKGWLTVEDGKHKLGDGNFIPRDDNKPQAQRVESYWRKKSVSQNWYAQGNRSSEDLETAMDEIRSLKVKLAQAKSVNQQRIAEPPTLPAFTATMAPTSVAPQIPVPDMSQIINTLLLKGLQASGDNNPAETFNVLTRAGQKQAGQGSNF